MSTLKREPVPARRYHVKKLKGYKDAYRIRVGRLRIVSGGLRGEF